MNTLRMYVTGLGILTFVATTAIAHAQTATEPLIVAGTRDSVLTRMLLLQTPSPTNSVQRVPLDPTGTDGNTILPAGSMSIPAVAVNQIKPDELTVPIQFDLQQVPTSGEFRGNLRLSYQSGAMVVPVMVRVKDFWLLPLLILLTGTALGMAVSAYRAKGQPRDELLVRVGQLRIQIQDDPDLARAGVFQSAVEFQLADVRLALQTGRLDTGNAAIARAEMIWSKWLRGRPDWLAQLAYYDELQQRLQDLNPQIPYVQTIRCTKVVQGWGLPGVKQE